MHGKAPGNSKRGRGGLRIVPFLAGPTGAGKTELVTGLDDRFEVVSLDSRQVYRFLKIGTAAPPARLMDQVPHHLVGIIDPDSKLSGAQYRRLALEAIRTIFARNKIPLLVGGAGFYLRMLQTGPFAIEESNEIRSRVLAMDHESRLKKLREVDPQCIIRPGEQPSKGRIHPNDAYRVERFLIQVLSSGKSMKEVWEEKEAALSKAEYEYRGLFLFPGEARLWNRLHDRASEMIKEGIVDETRDCMDRYGRDCPGLGTLGYKDVIRHIDGELKRGELIERLWISHRQYARRQRIWFQKQESCDWIDSITAGQLTEYAVNLFTSS